MLGDQYELEYLPLFDEELSDAVRYIAQALPPHFAKCGGKRNESYSAFFGD